MNRESFRNQATQSVDANWYNTERNARQTNLNAAQRNLNDVDPYYQNLFGELANKETNSKKALTASMIKRGVGRSGIMTNAESELGQTYAKLNANLQTEKDRRKGELSDMFSTARTSFNNIGGERSTKIEDLIDTLYGQYLNREAAKAQAASYSSGFGGGGGGGDLSLDARAKQLLGQLSFASGEELDKFSPKYGGAYARERVRDMLQSEYGDGSNRTNKAILDTVYKKYFKDGWWKGSA